MTRLFSLLAICTLPALLTAQNLGEGLLRDDLTLRPLRDVPKPAYLESFTDPSFGTTIRRISDAGPGNLIVPMYSTVQAWNADESRMILLNQTRDRHVLLDGTTYAFVRQLDDVRPADVEQIFWDFDDPDVFYYPEGNTRDFIRYTVSTGAKETIVNLEGISNCTGTAEMGNDVQMMSWDSDVFTWRCDGVTAFSYSISTAELTTFAISAVNDVAPAAAPSGNRYYHQTDVYAADGTKTGDLNETGGEHACLGKLANGNDAYFAISFAEGPRGGCLGDIIAHDLTTGDCFPVISQAQGYDYSQSGTHISALAHKNTQGGWLAASMVGYDRDGQALLDQELVIARVERGNVAVYRIGHHRSDEDQFDYYGEPHAVISPTGTRVLFGSDWSGADDGESVDSYVVELPAYSVALPVDLVFFTGRALDKSNELTWRTAAEENTEYYLLRRSTDGVTNWKEVARTQGAGSSTAERRYQLSDPNPLPTTFYRLSSIDFDGSEQRSDVIQINRTTLAANALTAFPNPAATHTVVKFDHPGRGLVSVDVFTANGEVVTRGPTHSGEFEINTESLATGLYFFRVYGAEGVVGTGRFIKR
ncbi:T9SS type A sorting domain-containing protein [Neolewinella antarctica]|uniref:Secretion system C-terminal sorting domain-containing protein n=1 Tax=Neolewinella antarctica TaxID=442734 RepID=A0ABX0XG70_9BACT|nr:T9SS type A sorting domain-containing protein [Neolewinella antarctica]NJC28313.1 hypothetical protein [Neolewinella antarctica]